MRGDEPGANDDQRPNGDYAPRAVLLQFSSVLRASILDHSVEVCARDANAEQRLRDLWLSASQHSLEPIAEISVHSQTDEQTHLAAIAQVKESILDGDVYLVNVARVLHSDTALTPQQMAVRVHRANSCYGAIMRGHGVTLAAMSMELGLRVDRVKNELETSPIKGTRPRSTDVQLDQRLALELEQSPKERAENVMAVDVHRNDLGKFAEVGSVVVHALCAVESHAYVHHLVSQIRCKICETTSSVAILRAMSPVGSVTGAPKRSAMQTIAQLERERRGVYTGFYGAVWPDGSMELAVAIRTIVNDCLGAHFGCGGGIVYDSDPDTEWQELQWKQRALSGKITNL